MKRISRREFIGSIAGVASAVFIGGCGRNEAASRTVVSRKSVFDPGTLIVARGDGPAKLTRAAVDALGGVGKLVKSGNTVVIKPNIAWNRPPDAAATTNPKVVAELVKMCREAGAAKVIVVDHPVDRPAEAVLNFTGIKPAAAAAGAEIKTAENDSDYAAVSIPKGKLINSDTVIRDILNADVFINVPVLKVHSSTTLTLSLKNLMGCNLDRGAWHASTSLDQCIADYATAVKPDLIVLDANRALLSNGPKGPGRTSDIKRVIAGTDPVAVDAYGASLLSVDAKSVDHIRLAHELGLGEIDLSKITVRSV